MSIEPVVHVVFPADVVAERIRLHLLASGVAAEKVDLDRLLGQVVNDVLDGPGDGFVEIGGGGLVEVTGGLLRQVLSQLGPNPDYVLYDAYTCDGSGFCVVRSDGMHVHLGFHIPWTQVDSLGPIDLERLWEPLELASFRDDSTLVEENLLGLRLARNGALPDRFPERFVFRLAEETVAALDGWPVDEIEAVAGVLEVGASERRVWAIENDHLSDARFAIESAGKLANLAALIRQRRPDAEGQ